jgi:hypothetical protein
METTKNELPQHAVTFFNKLSKYLDTKIFFFGSVQRYDYFPESSDVDADIFTDNEMSTIHKLQNFLGVKKRDFKKFVYKLHKTNHLITGYKIEYKDENNFSCELSIYNEKYKNSVLEEHNSKTELPFLVSFFLIILKCFYYKLQILPENIYKICKKFLMNYCVEGVDVEFVTTDLPEHKEK